MYLSLPLFLKFGWYMGSMMPLAVWLQDWRKKEMKQGHYLLRLTGKYPCQHWWRQMLLHLATEREVVCLCAFWLNFHFFNINLPIAHWNSVNVIIAAEDEEFGPGGKRIRPGISASIIGELTDCNAALSQQRKKRQVLVVMMQYHWNYSFFSTNWLVKRICSPTWLSVFFFFNF